MHLHEIPLGWGPKGREFKSRRPDYTKARSGSGLEADHPDGGPWLYGREPHSVDTITATRRRPDGRWEHAVLDAHGLPTEWRTAYRPELN
jgi:hypothetical protein